ncbi:MAG: 4-hydroxythreonine-4-phosphate dehydrogenase PdxA [Deferribacteres bacterium]|nr:4-hydroxythreonine-4-phosphate dehydrogenase PdxA [candidate division KSB1 bacterium]MCB9502929.1 4-hydroxythreonine-4-phosphate dehydrogenase PdxA [Deferribacteres bacterium]
MAVKIAITIGDINGIGPEIILKSLPHLESENDIEFVLIGAQKAFSFWSQKIFQSDINTLLEQSAANVRVIEPAGLGQFDISIGKPTFASGLIAGKSIIKAVEMALSGEVDAIVTAPISKFALQQAGFNYPGHTEFLAELSGDRPPVMLMVTGNIRIAVATTHVPLKDVAQLIHQELLIEKVEVLQRELINRFGIKNPSILITALNPHAGENGKIGHEEIQTIEKAIDVLRIKGIKVAGPYAADATFARMNKENVHDAYLAMYHDQGLIPFKIFSRGKGINYTCGLPFVRTSPDHGTAFDIAGKSEADQSSMMEAIRIAISHGKYCKRS